MIDINDIIDETIQGLADDNVNQGVDGLCELASYWAKAGLPYESFLDMRLYIINEAKEITGCPVFIDLKVDMAEKKARKIRNEGHSISNIITH